MNAMSLEKMMLLIFFLAFVVLLIVFNGITLKWGNKEFNFGGMRKKLSNKDDDEDIKERLKKTMDGIDRDMENDLYDLNEEISDNARRIYTGICYFPSERLAMIIKSVLDRRVDRNNLVEKLSDGKRQSYILEIKKDVIEKYRYFQTMSEHSKCGDVYPSVEEVREKLNSLIDNWENRARFNVIIPRKLEKIGIYKTNKEGFKVPKYRQKFCLNKLKDNAGYITDMGGVYEEKEDTK
jgi:hypothetical protein